MFKLLRKPINLVYAIHLSIVFLVALGAGPRLFFIFLCLLLVGFVITRPIEESILLFSRSIPFYVALPLSATFDSFNTWRIIVGLIFLKWLFKNRKEFFAISRLKISLTNMSFFLRQYKIESAFILFLFFCFVSLFSAQYFIMSVKRFVYLINLSLIFPVIVWIIRNRRIELKAISKSICISLFLVIAIGFLQIISTFLLTIDEFVKFWAEQIQLGFYGTAWSRIVASANTWFTYNISAFPKLRMFSVFPDSHSFPVYVLMSVPALFTVLLKSGSGKMASFFDFIRGNWRLGLCLFFAFLAAILSGTRGIWISIIFSAFLVLFQIAIKRLGLFKNFSLFLPTEERRIIKYTTSFFAFFILAFACSYIIMMPTQFKAKYTSQSQNMLTRVKSIVDVSEVSNRTRIYIWQASLKSFKQHPLFGVGIGNFPVILNQDVSLLKAGSSAHNLYLNILAEMGLGALLAFVALCYLILQACWNIFKTTQNTFHKFYSYAVMLYFVWIFGYSLTDAVLFDERAFLMFVLGAGIVIGLNRIVENSHGAVGIN